MVKSRVIADTNIWLRFLVNDVPNQKEKVVQCFRKAEAGKLDVVFLHVTIIEVLFHLEKWYGLSKVQASQKVQALIRPEWIKVERKEVILQALTLYAQLNIDFVDIITFCEAKFSNSKVLSFDKDFEKLDKSIITKF